MKYSILKRCLERWNWTVCFLTKFISIEFEVCVIVTWCKHEHYALGYFSINQNWLTHFMPRQYLKQWHLLRCGVTKIFESLHDDNMSRAVHVYTVGYLDSYSRPQDSLEKKEDKFSGFDCELLMWDWAYVSCLLTVIWYCCTPFRFAFEFFVFF